MSLAFDSLSHGEIAFGFFNAETDLLILDNYFFFASDFCNEITAVAQAPEGEPVHREWPVYCLKNEEIGSLPAAIHHLDLRGFIGEVYELFPLPEDLHDFGQTPEGSETRNVITETIERHCPPSVAVFSVDSTGATVEIGDYMFSREEFHELVRCIWVGGYPNWKNDVRPTYVTAMMESIRRSAHPLFQGMAPFI